MDHDEQFGPHTRKSLELLQQVLRQRNAALAVEPFALAIKEALLADAAGEPWADALAVEIVRIQKRRGLIDAHNRSFKRGTEIMADCLDHLIQNEVTVGSGSVPEAAEAVLVTPNTDPPKDPASGS
jgi:hypothetical protein